MLSLKIEVPEEMSTDTLPAFQRIAVLLRENIINGNLQAGQALAENELAALCDTSRNTLREALRFLHGEGLMDYQHNRGVFVRQLTQRDVRDIYKARRYLEVLAIQSSPSISEFHLHKMAGQLDLALTAANNNDWRTFGTHSLRFHQRIVHMLGCARFNEFFSVLLAQLRLLFASGEHEGNFQRPWLERDQSIFDLLKAQRTTEACKSLTAYLEQSEQQIMSAFTTRMNGV